MKQMSKKGRTWWWTALAALPLAAGACDTTSTGPAAGNTTVSLYVKDAPGDVANVWVQIDDVVLMSDSGKISLLQAPTDLIDLTTLQDEAMTLVKDLPVDPGAYHQLRFILGGAVLETSSGEVYSMGGLEAPTGDPTTGTLQCPSCAQSGIKVSFPGDVTMDEGTANGILMDFDVTQSFGHQAGNSGKWVMHPVIHGHVAPAGQIEGGNTGGTITGTVVLDDGNGGPTIPACDDNPGSLTEFVPMATGTSTDFSGQTDDAGNFTIDGLENDTYTLGYQAETTFTTNKLVWTAGVVPATATIDAQNTTVSAVVYTITAVSCEAITP